MIMKITGIIELFVKPKAKSKKDIKNPRHVKHGI
jgi:hypothetical protein